MSGPYIYADSLALEKIGGAHSLNDIRCVTTQTLTHGAQEYWGTKQLGVGLWKLQGKG